MTTKIKSGVIGDNVVGITQLNVSDGTNGQVLITDGAGTLSFSTISGYTDSDVETYLNTSEIYTDATNNRLGIGTNSPSQKLQVEDGNIYIRGVTEGEGLLIQDSTASTGTYSITREGSGSTGYLKFGTPTDETHSFVFDGGNVGIGTDDPDARLGIKSSGASSYPLLIKSSDNQQLFRFREESDTRGTFYINDASENSKVTLSSSGNSSFMGGNVGIGTDSPATELQIGDYSDDLEQITIATASDQTGRINFYNNNNTEGASIRVIGGGFGAKMYFANRYDSDSDKVTFDLVNGRVGIGTTNPEQVLHVYQAGDGKRPVRFTTGNNHDLDFYNDTDGWQLISEKGINLSSKNGGQLRFTTGSGSDASENRRMTIDTSGNIGAPTGTNIYNASDERLKQNISTLSNSLDVINALNPVQFNWIDNFEESENGKNLYGFVAQEVQDVFPDAVESFGTGDDIEVDGTVIENPLTVRDKFFIPVLVKAIQELKTELDAAKARIETLEG
jgi:hypothetical protein